MTAPSPATGTSLGGVIVATTLPYVEDPAAPAGLPVDYDRYAEHCDWLIANGCRGVGPNGSLGEYSSLTDEERRKVVQVAVETVGDRGLVVAGVHGVGWHQAQQWAEYAEGGRRGRRAAAAADDLPGEPRRGHRALQRRATRSACRSWSTTTRSTPRSTSRRTCSPRSREIENVVAVKEFSGRHPSGARDPGTGTDLDVIAGADDLLLRVAGRWARSAGSPATPTPSRARRSRSTTSSRSGELAEARSLYAQLVPVFRWDSRTEFVQAIKLSIDIAGESYGGPTRPPRGPLHARAGRAPGRAPTTCSARLDCLASASRVRPERCRMQSPHVHCGRLAHRGDADPGRHRRRRRDPRRDHERASDCTSWSTSTTSGCCS